MGLLVWLLGSAPAGAATVDVTQWPGRLNSISTVSSNHACAVGTHETSGSLLCWDGSRWLESSLDGQARSVS